jgi:hypothetical protein
MQGSKTKQAIQESAELKAFHSNRKMGEVQVNFGHCPNLDALI